MRKRNNPSGTKWNQTAEKPSNTMAKKKSTTKKGKGQTGKVTSKPIDLKTDLSGLTKPQEYLEYVTFMAIPSVKRVEIMQLEDDTQEAFCKKYKVNKNTLTDWKKRVGFWDDVLTIKKEFFKARTANVLLALETKNLDPAKVQGQDVRVLLTFTGEYTEKVESEHKVHPELQAALEKIGKVMA